MTWLRRRFEPVGLPPGVTIAFVLLFAALTVLRGWDYFNVEDPDNFAGVLLALNVPLRVWAFGLCSGGLLLIASILIRWHPGVWLGHVVLTAVYGGLSWLIVSTVLQMGSGEHNAIPPLGGLVWHAYFAHRVGRTPRHRSGGHHRGQHRHPA